ncbi:hypothetical protein MAL03_20125 (plasmid) [Leptospira noguchii]|uniref:Uncharacterized protein n=1 Tax=Leptospira noguchii TaxID=28182 RepID=A0AAE9GJ28_9LEPT|nr:hypothetical protein [Leptospira noguchii]UOG58872.1 hypothetical protein MAL03_20125 [Leptospira noguchii]
MKKKYNGIGEEITGEVDNRGLTYTRNSFLSYRDTLLNKNFQNSTQIQKQIQEGKNQVAGIITEGENYNQVQGMIQTAVLGQKPSYVKYAALSQLTYIKWNPYQAASE